MTEIQNTIKTFICPNCGGTMAWRINKQQFECVSCGTPGIIQNLKEDVQENDFSEYLNRQDQEVIFPEDTLITCSTCGASVTFDEHRTAAACPMCGSTQVIESKQIAGVPPDGIIPFQIDKAEAQINFRKWVKSRWFAPNRLKEAYQQGKLEGIYLPFWTFDAKATGHYRGEGGKEHRSEDKEGKTQTTVTWHSVKGQVSSFYDDYQVCASEGNVEEIVTDALPYNTKENTVPYASAYLSGFFAERYSVPADSAFNKFELYVESKLKSKAHKEIKRDYDQSRITKMDVEYEEVTYKQVLLPAWISAFSYNKKTYIYMINGENGNVSGKRPFSTPKIITAAIVAAAIVIAGILFFSSDADASSMNQPVSSISQTSFMDTATIQDTIHLTEGRI